MLRQRRELDPKQARQWSEWVQKHFLGAHCYMSAQKIGLYAAFDNEVDTRLAFEGCRAEGRTLAFPKISGPRSMIFMQVSHYEEMVPNKWGIPEPTDASPQVLTDDLDLVVVPGVAFDRNGHRLGFGAGYYDRLLQKLRPEVMTVGFAYGFQVVDRLPAAGHDQRLKRIITEKGFLNSDTCS